MTILRSNELTGAVDSIRLDRADFATIYPTFLLGMNNTIGFVLGEIKLFCDIFGDGKNIVDELVTNNVATCEGTIPIFEVAIKFNKIIKVPRVDEHDITVRKIPYREIDCTGMTIIFTKNIFLDGFRMFLQSNGKKIETWSWSYVFAKRKNGSVADAIVRRIERPLELRSRYLGLKNEKENDEK